jgi:hypothetical protein
MRVFLKKRVVAAFAVVAVLAVSGLALAYWTQPGGGAVSGAVAVPGAVTLSGSVSAGIGPGASEPVTIMGSNQGTTDVQIQTVHLVSIAPDVGHSTCVTADFTLPDVVENTAVPAGASNLALATPGLLSYANTALNQDACIGATLTITLSHN